MDHQKYSKNIINDQKQISTQRLQDPSGLLSARLLQQRSFSELHKIQLSQQERSNTIEKNVNSVLYSTTVMYTDERESFGKLAVLKLEEKDREAMLTAASRGYRIERESEKQKKKRFNSYQSLCRQYGDSITLETYPLMQEIKKYRKYSDKQKDKKAESLSALINSADLNQDLFNISYIQDSAAHIDIFSLLKNRDLFKKIHELAIDPASDREIKSLNAGERFIFDSVTSAYSSYETAVNAVLKQHCLKDDGSIDTSLLKNGHHKTSNTGLNETLALSRSLSHNTAAAKAIEEYKACMTKALKTSLNTNRLVLDESVQKHISETAAAVDINRGAYAEFVSGTFSEIASGKTYSSEEKENIRQLCTDCMTSIKQYQIYRTRMLTMKKLMKGGDPDNKLAANIKVLEHDPDYVASKQISKRFLRMVRGIGTEGYPLTLSMRLELAEVYHLNRFIKDITPKQKKREAYNGKTKIDTRLEKQADNLENLLGGRSTDTLAGKKEYQDIIRYINSKEGQIRKQHQKDLQEWLENTFASEKDSLSFEREIAENTDTADSLHKLGNKLKENLRYPIEDATDIKDAFMYGAPEITENESEEPKNLDEKLTGGISSGACLIINMLSLPDLMKTAYNTLKDKNASNFKKASAVSLAAKKTGHTIENALEIADAFFDKTPDILEKLGSGTSGLVSCATIIRAIGKLHHVFSDKDVTSAEKLSAFTFGTYALTNGAAATSSILNSAKAGSKVLTHSLDGISDILLSTYYLTTDNAKRHEFKHRLEHLNSLSKRLRADMKKYMDQLPQLERDNMNGLIALAGKNASKEHTNSKINMAASTAMAIGGGMKLSGAAYVGGTVLSGAGTIARIAGSVVLNNQKNSLKKDYINAKYSSIIKAAKESGMDFSDLSDRDIKRAVLKFVGVRSGKRSEAGIRALKKEAEILIKHNDPSSSGSALTILHGELKKALGLDDKSKEKDAMTRLGATEFQAENPIAASLTISDESDKRSTLIKPGYFSRFGHYLYKKIFA